MKITDQLSKLVRQVQVNRKDGKSNRNRVRRLLFEQMEDRRLLTTIDLAALTAAQGTIIYGARAGDESGFSVSNAGDVNGDGFEDLIIGAPYADRSLPSINYSGDSFVIFGGESLPAIIELSNLGSAGLKIVGADASDRSGRSVSSAGDVNGDGFGDLLIGARFAAGPLNTKYAAGDSYLIYGGPSLPYSIDLTNIGSAGVTLFGGDVEDQSGYSLSNAGDVNGDGFADVLVGARQADGNGNGKLNSGESYLIFGGSSLPDSINMADFDSVDVTIVGADAFDFSGTSVSSAGDVNGDGFSDLFIGAPGGDGPGNATQETGEGYVIYGASAMPAIIDLANLGSNGVTIFGVGRDDGLGGRMRSLSNAGDINGDGFADLLIAASFADAATNAKLSAGDTYLIYGGPSIPTIINLLNLGSAGITIFGAEVNDQSGISVSAAGDLNGDGFDDLAIGAHYADALGNSKRYAGDSYVIFGDESLPAIIDLAIPDSADFTIVGASPDDRSGRSVSGAGDVNGDGFDDLLIGAPGGDAPRSDYGGNLQHQAGESYLIFGGNFSSAITHQGTASSETLTGTSAANVMNGARGNDILIGNGGADVLIGGQGNDILAVSDLNFKRIVGGTGTDTLRLDGSGLHLDMTAIRDNRILGIEQIDVTGTGNNTLTLNYREVLNISDESNTLVVRRNAGDVVNFGTGWTQAADQTIGSDTFAVYTQGIATLKLQSVSTPPSDISISNNTIFENTAYGTVVGVFSASGDTAFTYSLVDGIGGDHNGAFSVNSTENTLITNSEFDFETQSNFSIRIRAYGSSGLYSEQTFSIRVTDVNEAPTAIALSSTAIAENNSANAVVGTFSSTDVDLNDTFSYSLAAGAGDVDNAAFTIVGSDLLANAAFNFESKAEYTIRVRSTDADGLFFEQDFTINVTDVNEAPVVANPILDFSVLEGTTTTDIDLALVFADVDDSILGYTVQVGNEDLLATSINGTVLTITYVSGSLGSTSITVTATDSGNLSISDDFVVTVEAVSPEIVITGPLDGYSGVVGQQRILRFRTTDVASSDQEFTYEVQWGDGLPVETFTGPATFEASHTFTSIGAKVVQVRVIDEDSNASEWVTKTLTIARTEVQGNVLAIGGNTGDDVLTFTPGASSPMSQVLLNAVSLGAINVPTGGIKFFGGSGNDTLIMNGTAGNDIVTTDVASIVWNGSTTWPQAVRLDSEGVEKLRVQTQAGNDEIVINGGNAEVDGGTGTDRMTGPNSGGLWNVTEAGIGTLNGLSFLGIETVLGGSGDDAFVFGSAGAFTGIVDGKGGQDTLNLSAKTTAITISLLANTATSTGGIRNIEQFVGGSATTDTFTAPNTANAWQLTGPKSGSLNSTVGFSGFETLRGGTSTDGFAVEPAASSFTSIDGGSGTDSLIYSGFSSGIQVDLATRTAPGVASFIGIESLIGSSASDLLIGPNSANAWTINGPNSGALGTTLFQSFESIRGGTGNDTVTLTATGGLTGSVDGATGTDTLIGPSLTEVNVDWTITSTGSGVVNTVSFLGMENLTGGTSVDRFFMSDGGSVIGTINGGINPTGKRDQLNYAAVSTPVAIDLATNGYTNVGLISGIEEVVGTAGSSDLIRGGNVANTWSLTGTDTGTVGSLRFVDIENLTGGTLADSFSLVAGGSVRGTMRGGLGVDTLLGANANNVWRVQGQNTGLINTMAYQEIESLTGGSATDTFVMSPSGSVGGVLNAGSGTADRLDFSNWSSLLVLNLQTRSLPGGGTFTGVEQVVGSLSSGDLLIGPNATTSWSISGVDSGTAGAIQFSGFETVQGGSANDTFTLGVAGALTGVVRGGDGVDTLVGPSPGLGSITEWNITSSGGGNIRDVDFEGIENLTGGNHLDRFLFNTAGEVTGTINGGASGTGERDQVSYAAVAAPITIDLQAKTQPRATLLVGIEELVGTVASDELRGLNVANTWSLTAANTGTVGTFRFIGFENLRGGTLADTFSFVAGGTVANLDGGSGTDTILGPNVVTHWDLQSPGQGTIGTSVFASIENLTGGTAVDTFNISPSGTLAGALNGGTTGRNVLSYAAWSSSVTVNLATKVASGIAGNVSNFTIVQGGSGNDQLSGNSTLGTILLGMHGNDSLVGVSGRDILIGGFGGDTMTGGVGDDLLIAGATVYDNDVGSLSRIFDEWSTTSRNYQTRVNNLRGIGTGPRFNGELFLQNAPSYTLYADPGSLDQLIGGLGQDWFITDDLADSVDQALLGVLAELRDNVSNLA
jgi:hypothetical protein